MATSGVRCIAVMAVGGSEFVAWDAAPEHGVPGGPRTDAQAVASALRSATGDELVELAASLRHIRTLEELSSSYPGEFDLVLIGTRQPDTVDAALRRSDTWALADAVRRTVVAASTRGVLACREVRVEEIALADVNEPSDELAVALSDALEPVVADPPPELERIVFIQPGGTPAMRILLERAVAKAARRLGVPAEMRWTSAGHDAVRPRGLLRVIEADIVERNAAQRIVDAVRGARYAGANALANDLPPSVRQPVAQLLELGSAVTARTGVDSALARAQQVIPAELHRRWKRDPAVPRRADIEARIGLVRGAERDGRIEDALISFATATELLPALLAETLAKGVLGRSPQPTDLVPQGTQRVLGREIRSPSRTARLSDLSFPEAARWACVCAAWTSPRRRSLCDICSANLPLVAEMAKGGRALAAIALREDEDGEPSAMVKLRNAVVHRAGQAPGWEKIRKALRTQWEHLGRPTAKPPTTLADMLVWAVTTILGEPPADPLAGIEAEIERILTAEGLLESRAPGPMGDGHSRS